MTDHDALIRYVASLLRLDECESNHGESSERCDRLREDVGASASLVSDETWQAIHERMEEDR